jgi:Tfp pilus assembly protein PilF
MTKLTSILALILAGNLAWPVLAVAAEAPGPTVRKRREPPPAVIPADEVKAAQKLYDARNYQGAVIQAKAALNKNERYTPAMLVMAKAYFKLGKNEWVKTLGDMMKNAGASEAERSDIYQMLAFMEVDKKNTPGAIEQFRKAAEARPDNAILWNNLGAQYLVVKNYREAGPVLEKAVQLQPTFTKAHLNLGSAYRGRQAVRQGAGRVQAGPGALPALRRCGLQSRHPVPGRRQDAQHGRDGQAEHRHHLSSAVQADAGRRGTAGAGRSRCVPQRGAGRHQERAEAHRAAKEAGRARSPARGQEDRGRRQEARGSGTCSKLPSCTWRGDVPGGSRSWLSKRTRGPGSNAPTRLSGGASPSTEAAMTTHSSFKLGISLATTGLLAVLLFCPTASAQGTRRQPRKSQSRPCLPRSTRPKPRQPRQPMMPTVNSQGQGRTRSRRQEGLQDRGRDCDRGQDPETRSILRASEIRHKLRLARAETRVRA